MKPYGIFLVGPVTCSYDEFDSFVVVAKDKNAAKRVAAEAALGTCQVNCFMNADVKRIGVATKRAKRVVLGSFNAG